VECPLLADIIAKVENRDAPKISRKLILRHSCRCKALWRRYEGPWSFLCETMRSLISPRAKRINGSSSLLKNLEMEIFLILAGRCQGGVVELDVIF